jgi:hypothetical protein
MLLNELWRLPQSKRYVPCPCPRSLERKDLPLLLGAPYVVSEKTDGVRMFLLFGAMEGSGETYSVLIDRAYHIYPLALDAPNSFFDGTLLDAEYRCGDAPTLTVFDALVHCGYLLRRRPFHARHDTYMSVVKELRTNNALRIVPKLWSPLSDAQVMWNGIVASGRAADGLILQPLHGDDLTAGIQRDVFKWKPPHLHTIDMYLHFDGAPNGAPVLRCGNGGGVLDVGKEYGCVLIDTDQPGSTHTASFATIPFSVLREACVASGSIVVEVGFVSDAPGGMRLAPHRIRTDKTTANDRRVVEATFTNIREAIGVHEFSTAAVRAPVEQQ